MVDDIRLTYRDTVRRGLSEHPSISRYLFYAVGPSILIVSPLIGLAFQSDQRKYIYAYAYQIGANPLRAIKKIINEIGPYLGDGNFRPFGRFMIYLEESARFEVSVGTGIPPHIVQGIMRLVMVSLLTLIAIRIVLALSRSAEFRLHRGSRSLSSVTNNRKPMGALIEIFPIVFASTLIVTGTHHPISLFPFFLISMVAVLLVVPLYVASDRGMVQQGIAKIDAIFAALAGILAAITYELLYLLPIICLGMIIIRGKLAGFTNRAIYQSRAFSRFIVLCSGFLLVFIPVRIVIAQQCIKNDCYDGSELAILGVSIRQWIAGLYLEHQCIVGLLHGDLILH